EQWPATEANQLIVQVGESLRRQVMNHLPAFVILAECCSLVGIISPESIWEASVGKEGDQFFVVRVYTTDGQRNLVRLVVWSQQTAYILEPSPHLVLRDRGKAIAAVPHPCPVKRIPPVNAPLVIADRFGIKGAVTTQKRVVTTQNPSTERHLSTTAKILYGRAVHIDAPCFPLTDRKQDGADRV